MMMGSGPGSRKFERRRPVPCLSIFSVAQRGSSASSPPQSAPAAIPKLCLEIADGCPFEVSSLEQP